jgi:hypothetical protein
MKWGDYDDEDEDTPTLTSTPPPSATPIDPGQKKKNDVISFTPSDLEQLCAC